MAKFWYVHIWMIDLPLTHLWRQRATSLLHTAKHRNILQQLLQHTVPQKTTSCQSATHCNTLQHTAIHCTALHLMRQRATSWLHTSQHTATHCNTLHLKRQWAASLLHTATHCNTLQHTATHYNTLQHTAPQKTKNCQRAYVLLPPSLQPVCVCKWEGRRWGGREWVCVGPRCMFL